MVFRILQITGGNEFDNNAAHFQGDCWNSHPVGFYFALFFLPLSIQPASSAFIMSGNFPPNLRTSVSDMRPVQVVFDRHTTGQRLLQGFARSMGLQHSHRSGLRNCCKARRQTCFNCRAALFVLGSRPHAEQSESVTLLLTSLFQIRAKNAGWPKSAWA